MDGTAIIGITVIGITVIGTGTDHITICADHRRRMVVSKTSPCATEADKRVHARRKKILDGGCDFTESFGWPYDEL